MRLFLLILLIPAWLCCDAQNGYKVFYKSEINTEPVTENGKGINHRPRYIYLVVNDSASIFYGSGEKKKDPVKKGEIYGHKIFHKARLEIKDSGYYYTGVAYPEGVQKLFVIDSVKKRKWTVTAERKEILGYSCRKAFWVNEYIIKTYSVETWQSDSCIAWYTENIPMPYGPGNECGLPGIVLENRQDGLFGVVLTYAVSISRENVVIGIPARIPVLTFSEFRRSSKPR